MVPWTASRRSSNKKAQPLSSRDAFPTLLEVPVVLSSSFSTIKSLLSFSEEKAPLYRKTHLMFFN
jgi:hypothetical protein